MTATYANAHAGVDRAFALPAGRLDDTNPAVDPTEAASAQGLLALFAQEGIRAPYVYPTDPGGIQFEWDPPLGVCPEIDDDGIDAWHINIDAPRDHRYTGVHLNPGDNPTPMVAWLRDKTG